MNTMPDEAREAEDATGEHDHTPKELPVHEGDPVNLDTSGMVPIALLASMVIVIFCILSFIIR